MFLKYIYFFKTYFLFKQNNSSVLIVLLSVKLTFSIFIYLKYLLKKTTHKQVQLFQYKHHHRLNIVCLLKVIIITIRELRERERFFNLIKKIMLDFFFPLSIVTTQIIRKLMRIDIFVSKKKFN